jgi:hypothetical protein
MSGFLQKIIGYVTGNGLEVNSSNEAKVVTDKTRSSVTLFSENDPGTITGVPLLMAPEISADYRLRVGIDTVLFTDTFNATTQNSNLWAYTLATLTCTQPGGYLQFGTVQGTGAGHGAFIRSFQYFPLVGTAPLSVEFSGSSNTSALVPNEAFYAGLGLPSAAATIPTDGCWFKMTSSGLFGELQYNGGTVVQVTLMNTQIPLATNAKFAMVVGEDAIRFWVDDVLYGSITIPAGYGQPFMTGSLPVFLQKICTGTVSNTNTIRITDVTVSLMDLATGKPWSHQVAGMGQHALFMQNGTTIPTTGAKTTVWANNTAPTAVALTNTAASFTGLGGIAAVLPTLTANNDGKLFTYQVPAGTINLTARNLYITRVTLKGAVSVVLVGGPVIYAYALAVGHTATSLATAETASFATATAHAPRIMALGMESYAATAAVGTLGTGIDLNFDTPICVRPGEFVDIIARNIGTVTTTGAITIVASVGGYWE